MFGKRITLFTVFGIAVGIDLSWVFLALLIAWSLAEGFFPLVYEGLPTFAYWWMGVAGVAGLFLSIVAHELTHSVVAKAFGTPVKGITLFFLGGVAEMGEEPTTPGGELLMALAGPLMSAVLALVFHGAAALAGSGALALVLSYLAAMNALLAAFNMVPAFPLDGGRVLRAILWKWRGDMLWATRIAAGAGDLFGWLLIALGVLNALQGNFGGGIWWGLLGFFVRAAARSSLRQLQARRLLAGMTVRRFMTGEPVTVEAGTTVATFVEDYIYRLHFDLFPVVEGGRLVGSAGSRQVRQVPRERWNEVTAGEIAVPPGPETAIEADDEALKALSLMQTSGASRLLVTDRGRLVGIVVLKDLLEVLALKLELEG